LFGLVDEADEEVQGCGGVVVPGEVAEGAECGDCVVEDVVGVGSGGWFDVVVSAGFSHVARMSIQLLGFRFGHWSGWRLPVVVRRRLLFRALWSRRMYATISAVCGRAPPGRKTLKRS
jgi:hypothetical protein